MRECLGRKISKKNIGVDFKSMNEEEIICFMEKSTGMNRNIFGTVSLYSNAIGVAYVIVYNTINRSKAKRVGNSGLVKLDDAMYIFHIAISQANKNYEEKEKPTSLAEMYNLAVKSKE